MSEQTRANTPKANEQAADGRQTKPKRRLRNLFLQPQLQTRIALYFIAVSGLFAASIAAILYHNFAGMINSVVMLTDAEDEVRELFVDYWSGTQIWIYSCFLIYVLATVAISVLYTHKLVGPTIAFRRHVRSLIEGRYGARTFLRRGDAFSELGDDLNHLSSVLEASKNAGK